MPMKKIPAAESDSSGPKNCESANQARTEALTISIEHAAKMLGISRSAAYNYARDGSLPTIKIGSAKRHRLLVPKAAFERLLMPA
jgi:excisionase family DNA binding protein